MQTIHHLNKDLGIPLCPSPTTWKRPAGRPCAGDEPGQCGDGRHPERGVQPDRKSPFSPLDVPQAAELRDELVKVGIPMPEGIIDTGECAQALYELLK